MKKELYPYFLGKFCSLKKKDNFVLFGTIDDIDESGVLITTRKFTTWIGWEDILSLTPTTEKVN